LQSLGFLKFINQREPPTIANDIEKKQQGAAFGLRILDILISAILPDLISFDFAFLPAGILLIKPVLL